MRTDENQVRRVIHEFNTLGTGSLRPHVGGGGPRAIDQPTRGIFVVLDNLSAPLHSTDPRLGGGQQGH